MSASFSLSISNHTAAALNLENSISSLQCAGQLLLGCAVSEHPAAALPKQGLMWELMAPDLDWAEMDLGREQHLWKFLDGSFSASPSISFWQEANGCNSPSISTLPTFHFQGCCSHPLQEALMGEGWLGEERQEEGEEGGGVWEFLNDPQHRKVGKGLGRAHPEGKVLQQRMSLQHPWVPSQVDGEQPSGNLSSEDLLEDDLVSAGR